MISPAASITVASSVSDRPGEIAAGFAGRMSTRRAVRTAALATFGAGSDADSIGAERVTGFAAAVVGVVGEAAESVDAESCRGRSATAGGFTLGGATGLELLAAAG
jgi:hypothetical protein